MNEESEIISQLSSIPQSRGMQSFRATPRDTVQRFIELCLNTVQNSESSKITNLEYRQMCGVSLQRRRAYFRACVLQMLKNEVVLIPAELSLAPYYYVFYRMVNEQIVLYELNTQILENFGFMPPRRSADHNSSIVCTPYLKEDSFYPSSKMELMEWFYDGGNDTHAGTRDEKYHLGLLCVNNCLHPKIDFRGFNKLVENCSVEAEPLVCFADGYSAGTMTESAMALSLTTAYDITEDDARALVSRIMSLYKAWENGASDTGHCIQIIIPNTLEALDEFVHLSPAYGRPVAVYRDPESNTDFAVETFNSYLVREAKGQTELEFKEKLQGKIDAAHLVSMREVLSCGDMAYLQARIIGHPRLFYQYGAQAKVFSADSDFSLRDCVGQEIRRLLHDLSRRDKSKPLTFQKMLSMPYHDN